MPKEVANGIDLPFIYVVVEVNSEECSKELGIIGLCNLNILTRDLRKGVVIDREDLEEVILEGSL